MNEIVKENIKPIWLKLKEFSEKIAGKSILEIKNFRTDAQAAWNCIVWAHLSETQREEIRQAVAGRESASNNLANIETAYNGSIKLEDNSQIPYIEYLHNELLIEKDSDLQFFGRTLSKSSYKSIEILSKKLSIRINTTPEDNFKNLDLSGLIVPSSIIIAEMKNEDVHLSLNNTVCLAAIEIYESNIYSSFLSVTLMQYLIIKDSSINFFNFENLTANSFLHFINCNFSANKYSFSGRASIFNSDVIFEKCDFNYSVDFNHCIFKGDDISFRKSKFLDVAHFNDAQFNCEKVSFAECEFLGYANFNDAHFNQCTFVQAQFLADVDFSKATFNKEVFFQGAEFKQAAIFRNAKFLATEKTKYIKDHHYQISPCFIGTKFTGIALFEDATFKIAPHFEGAEAKSIIFTENSFENRNDFDYEFDKRAWIALIRLCEENHDFKMRHIFYNLFQELQIKNQETNNTDKFNNRLDKIYSYFGNGASIHKPIIGWIVAFFFFGLIYTLCNTFAHDYVNKSYCIPWKCGFETSLNHTFSVLPSLPSSDDKLTFITKIVINFQKLFNVAMFFLIGLGLRYRYRIK
jgi:uncharacterized protein YjbI with pentapeptide repeats